MQLNGKRSIVFGANGYVGSHLANKLIQYGYVVQAFDIQENSIIPSTNYQKLDITDRFKVENLDWDVDLVFIFAGITGTYNGFEEYERFVVLNEIGLLNILTAIRKSGHKPRIIFPSTRLVYVGNDSPLKEDAPKETKTIYAVNKMACENILNIYQNSFGLDYTIYRLCVLYGNDLNSIYSYGTIGSFLNQASENKKITLFGNGSLERTFTHIDDVCEQILISCINPISVNKIYNIAGESYSLVAIAKLISTKYNAILDFIPWPDKELRIESGNTVFDSSKLLGEFQLSLKRTFSEWLRQVK